jgi:hypothetical protein
MLELSEKHISKIEKKLDYFKQLGFEVDDFEERAYGHWRYSLSNLEFHINWNYYHHYMSDRLTDSFTLTHNLDYGKRCGFNWLIAHEKSFDKFIKIVKTLK